MNKEWFIIDNLENFINGTRSLVFNNFGKNDDKLDELKLDVRDDEREELDKVLSYQECLLIAKEVIIKQKNKKTLERRYIVSNEAYHSYIGLLNQRMVANLLNGLVSKGLIETAFDSESNDFIFWTKDDTQN